MDKYKSQNLRDLFKQYSGAVAYIEICNSEGDRHIGSAFHVGGGIFVTARHVIEGHQILEIATTAQSEIMIECESHEDSELEKYIIEPRILSLVEGPYYPADKYIDIAVFKVTGIDPRTPRIPLGAHFDFDIGDDKFVLTKAVVLGYPPIPNTVVPRLIAARAEVNAVINVRQNSYVHFIISALARGGFSGGVVLSEYGHALGLVTESQIRNDIPPELGFMTVLAVEPIYKCINENFSYDENEELAYVHSCMQRYCLTHERLAKLNPRLVSISITLFDDDRDVFIELTSNDSESLRLAFSAINRITPVGIVDSLSRTGYIFVLPKENPPKAALEKAVNEAIKELNRKGYTWVSMNGA